MQPDEQPTQEEAIGAQINAAIAAAIGSAQIELPPLLGGVPEGYTALREYQPGSGMPPIRSGGVAAPAQYREGDEFNPGGWTQERRARMQRMLADSGLLRTAYRSGFWGPESVSAYRALLSLANTQGMKDTETARLLASDPDLQKTLLDSDKEPYLQPDPARAREDIRGFFRSKLKRDVTDDELTPLFNEYMRLDRATYDVAVQDGVVEVDPAARFSEFLTSRYRPEIDRTAAMVDLSNNNENLMGSIFALDRAIA